LFASDLESSKERGWPYYKSHQQEIFPLDIWSTPGLSSNHDTTTIFKYQHSAMDIPGFFFDPMKKKYFKIQKNHVAPPESPYSREAVTNHQLQAQTGQRQQLHHHRVLCQRLKHDPRLRHPLTSFNSRLGNAGPGSATSTVAEYYGAALQRRTKPIVPLHCSSSQFVVGTFGGRNVLMGSFGNYENGESAMVSQPLDEDCRRTSEPEYLHRTTGNIGSIIMTNGLLAWTENAGMFSAPLLTPNDNFVSRQRPSRAGLPSLGV
jgi:hypothetical protein